MELPQIDTIPVQESNHAIAQVDEARRRTFQVFEQGLGAIGAEMVKSQTNRAAASLATSLSQIESDLAAKKVLTTQEVRDALGGSLDSLPPEVRAQVAPKGLDITTGEIKEMDIKDAPAFAVAGAIFDAQAKKALAAASQNISTGGFRADFMDFGSLLC